MVFYVQEKEMGGRKMGLDELFIQKDTVLTLYTGQERDVVIPPEITCVARYVFYRKVWKPLGVWPSPTVPI